MPEKMDETALERFLAEGKKNAKMRHKINRREISTLDLGFWLTLNPAEKEGLAMKIARQWAPTEKSKAQVKKRANSIVYLTDAATGFRPCPDTRKKDTGVASFQEWDSKQSQEFLENLRGMGIIVKDTRFVSSDLPPEKPVGKKKKEKKVLIHDLSPTGIENLLNSL